MTKRWKQSRNKRDGIRFLTLPMVVIDSPAYRAASHVARSLLIDTAKQYTGTNNGKLVCCRKYLRPLGWKSAGVITRARCELVELGLLCETRKGARPNRAGWFALTWQALDITTGLDIDPRQYITGAYMRVNGASLCPSDGLDKPPIIPSNGQGIAPASPPQGAIKLRFASSPGPSGGLYLAFPSKRRFRG
jgi:hypothetical protein